MTSWTGGARSLCPSSAPATARWCEPRPTGSALSRNPTCRACGEEPEDAEHLLAECPAHVAARAGFWGHCPTLEDVLSGSAKHIIDFLRRVGRVEPPADPPPDGRAVGPALYHARERERERNAARRGGCCGPTTLPPGSAG